MSDFERFHYKTLDQLRATLDRLGLKLPTCDDVGVLARPLTIGGRTAPNRFAIQPMEGCDCTGEGTPTELTRRRYLRLAAGGAGLIWFEACAIVPEGRANPRQMMLTERNADAFARMVEEVRAAARGTMGPTHQPVLILQLTHSGRYSKPEGEPAPVIAQHSPLLDAASGLPADYPLVTDEYLDGLQDAYVRAAGLAARVGFDGVGVKSCHGYLIAELLGSFTRADSRYGGPELRDRARLLLESHARISAAHPDLIVTCRLNTYDAMPHPHGWGVEREDAGRVDLTEPLELAGILREHGAPCLNVTAGNPYYHSWHNRPFDYPVAGAREPGEHPLAGVHRMIDIGRQVQAAEPELAVVGSGYSYLRQFMPWFATGAVGEGWSAMVGLGRQAFAYPDFARDVLTGAGMDPLKCCIACSCCTQMMRDGRPSGCVVRDREVYAPIFREGRRMAPDTVHREAERCRDCVAPTCQAACPAGVDVPGFVRAVAEGDLRAAYAVLRSANPLPELCAYVCPVETQCEGACIEGAITGRPVPVRDIQLHVCRVARREGWAGLDVPEAATGGRVAVVGAGPAGLACAIHLLEEGHAVTVFDAADGPGGLARRTIPAHRLGDDEVKAELGAILADAPPGRIEWRFGTALGRDVELDGLLADCDAVLLAVGLGGAATLGGADAPAEGVEGALDFLRRMKADPGATVPARVAVLGGGNTAMDAAVVARRRGAEDVYVVYRRSFGQMPAWPAERDEALRAGIHFLILTQAVGYVADGGGRLAGVRTVRTVLGAPDESGRRRPEPVPESEAVLPADLAVEAIGQRLPDELAAALGNLRRTEGGLLAVDERTMRTSREGVYAAGDVVNGGTTAVRAVAEGLRAGRAMCRAFGRGESGR